MEIKDLDISNINDAAKLYVEYYNNNEGSAWTFDKAYARIHKIVKVENSYSICIYKENCLIGFIMGFIRTYDDLLSYYLDEILVSKDEHNKNVGSMLIDKLEEELKKKNISMIELISVNDEMHKHFYEDKHGFYLATNHVCRGKFL